MSKQEHRYIGKPYPIHDAVSKVTGRAVYTVDMRKPNSLFAAMLFSTVAHGYIESIDTSAAEALEGVHFVATHQNTPDFLYNSARRFKGHNMRPDEQMFPRTVRYVGDRVAAVVADTQEIAEKACKLIKVVYTEFPFYLNPSDALAPDAKHLHEGGNQLGELIVEGGDTAKAFAQADHVFEDSYEVPMVHHYAMEPHACFADSDGEEVTIWSSSQNIFAFRILVADILDIPVNRVRVIRPTTGGGFGGKYEMVLEPVAAFLALKVRRPVLLELSRKDSIISTRTKHAAKTQIKIGVQNDGHITAIEYRELLNAGAYASSSMNVLGGASAKAMMLYHAPNIRFHGTAVYTNTPVGGAMRGYGSQQVENPLELHMDSIAKKMGFDPVEFRMKNLVDPGDINPAKKISLGNARIKDCLEKGIAEIGWSEEVVSEGTKRRAFGFACGVHGNGVSGVMIDTTGIILKLTEDGSLLLFTGTQDIGQGNVLVHRQIAGEVLQIDPNEVVVIEADTHTTPFDMGTFSSRCTWVSGSATKEAAEKLRDRLIEEAALKLDCAKEELEIQNGAVVVKNNSSSCATYGELAVHAQQVSCTGELMVHTQFYSKNNPGSYCADFAQVEVDVETGEVRVLDFVAVHDVGQAVNPMLLEGQIEGGIQMGLGYGLSEEMLFDAATGKPLNANTKKYKMFYAQDMPKIKIFLVEEFEPNGPFGAKSIGEIATVAVGAAVVNAVNRAIGKPVKILPATPARILQTLE